MNKKKQENQVIIAYPFTFYSKQEKELVHKWIKKIKCIKKIEQISKRIIHLVIDPNKKDNITFTDFANIEGLFKRYNLKNISQLKDLFMNKSNKDWFDGM